MMSPAGVDEHGRYLGNVWHLLHSALWNPLNVHRFLADIMSGGAVVIAYSAYRFLTSKSKKSARISTGSDICFCLSPCARCYRCRSPGIG